MSDYFSYEEKERVRDLHEREKHFNKLKKADMVEKAVEVEKGWMVRRDDGMFFAMEDYKGCAVFCDNFNIFNGVMNTKKECKNIIKFYNLQNCKPVKVEIRVVGGEDE